MQNRRIYCTVLLKQDKITPTPISIVFMIIAIIIRIPCNFPAGCDKSSIFVCLLQYVNPEYVKRFIVAC